MNSLRTRLLSLSLVTLAALSLLPGRTAATQADAPARQAAFDALQQRAGVDLEVHWDARSGVADFLTTSDPLARLPTAPAQGRDAAGTALGFLADNRTLFGLTNPAEELELLRIEPDQQRNYTHIRLAQVYRGIAVFGKQLVVHLDPQQRVVTVNGQIAPDLRVPTEPSISAQQAEAVALRDLLEQQLEPDERIQVKTEVLHHKTRLVIYVDQAGQAALAWYVTIMTRSPLGQWRSFVHARRPRVVHAFDSLASARRRITYTAENTSAIPGRQIIDEGERSGDQVAQAAHDAAGIVYDYYFKSFKRDGIDGQGSPIVSTVHFGSHADDAENAAWVGEAQQMIYGDGGRIFRPLSYGLDVVAHELTHGVTEHTAQLIYEGQPGALNESYSDVFGTLIDDANWTLGEQIVQAPPFPAPFLRSLEDPNMNGLYAPDNPLRGIGQPAHVREYARLPLSRRADNGGVHINSGIPNHAAYFVAQAIGREKMAQIYYRALTQYLTPESDFADAARATVQAARELYGEGETNAVRNAFAQVGIDVAGGEALPAPGSEAQEPPSGPAQPVPSQSLPAGCSNLVTSGDFEGQGDWTEVSTTNAALIDAELPHTGVRSAWLGGTDEDPLQYVYQDVRVPANATSVRLNYYRLIHQEAAGILGLLAGEATFSALIARTDGNLIGAVEQLSSRQGDDTWREARFDLSQLAGKTVRLVFAAENPPGNSSSFFVDDVALVACATGEGPAAPQPSAQNTVYIQGTVSDADTGRGVASAQIYILRPGLSATQAAADDTVSRDEVISFAATDERGFYQSEAAVPSGQAYSVIILARGYRPIVADDGMRITSGAANPFVADATLRSGR